MDLVGRPGCAVGREPLEVELEVGQDVGVDQLAQLLGAEQLPEELAVEGESGGAALGQRSVTLVHVGGDPAEQEALGERRRLLGVDGDEPHAAGAKVGEDAAQSGDVEHVLEALPRGLQQDREAGVLGGDGEEVGGPLALLPERRAAIGPAPRQQERTGGALPKARGEQGRVRAAPTSRRRRSRPGR